MVLPRTSKTAIQAAPLREAAVRLTPAALALLAAALMALHRADALPVEKLRAAVTGAAAPVLSLISAPLTILADAVAGAPVRDLRAENIRLAEENAKLKGWYETAIKLQAENQSLRELLNVKPDPSMSFVTARVIADAGGAFVKSVLVPAGSADGVHKGAAAMSGRGLVGRVTEAGETSSRVLLVTDLNSRIPVIIQGTRTKAILTGKNGALMRLERLPPDSGVPVGARIVTSGDGGGLPADLPVGAVVSADKSGLWVEPLADIDRLTHVQIVNVGGN